MMVDSDEVHRQIQVNAISSKKRQRAQRDSSHTILPRSTKPRRTLGEDNFDGAEDSLVSRFERISKNPIEKAFSDKTHIERKLRSGSFAIVLQTVSSKSSHCRAWNCLPNKVSGRPNIRSDFRFNVMSLSGLHYQPNQYYHISCMEQIFIDLTPLVRNGQLKMEGGITAISPACWSEERFHQAIEDWFENGGRTYDVTCYEDYNKAYEEWNRESSIIDFGHQLKNHEGDSKDCKQCENTADEPQKSDYFPKEPRVCFLSEVLASVAGVPHIDGLISRTRV